MPEVDLTADQVLRLNALQAATEAGKTLFSEKDSTPQDLTDNIYARAEKFYEFLAYQSDVKGIIIFERCVRGNLYGECVLENNHDSESEGLNQENPRKFYQPRHIDRKGLLWAADDEGVVI